MTEALNIPKGKKIFITGGAGFIASHLIEKLIEANQIAVYDNLTRNALRYTNFKEHSNLTFIEGDVMDRGLLARSMAGSDICIHAAAIAGIYSVGTDATRTMKVNFIGTYNALEAAVENRVGKFVDFSTSEVYGPFIYKGKETDLTTLGPVGEERWVYAVSKLAGEHFVHTYTQEYDLRAVTVRPFNVYGPRQVGEGAIQQMVSRALKNEDIVVYNGGTQIRSWCYVTDFTDALCKALCMNESGKYLFNIGNPQGTITVLGLAEQIIRKTNSRSGIVFREHPGPEVEMRIPDISLAKEVLGFEPCVNLEEGLERTIQWYREHEGE